MLSYLITSLWTAKIDLNDFSELYLSVFFLYPMVNLSIMVYLVILVPSFRSLILKTVLYRYKAVKAVASLGSPNTYQFKFQTLCDIQNFRKVPGAGLYNIFLLSSKHISID